MPSSNKNVEELNEPKKSKVSNKLTNQKSKILLLTPFAKRVRYSTVTSATKEPDQKWTVQGNESRWSREIERLK